MVENTRDHCSLRNLVTDFPSNKESTPMKLAILGIALVVVFLSLSPALAQDAAPGGDKYIYADFEKTDNGRVVSNGGGLVQIFTGQESTPCLLYTSDAADERSSVDL